MAPLPAPLADARSIALACRSKPLCNSASQLNDFRNSLVFTFDRTGPGALVVENIPALHARLSRWVESNLHELEAVLPLERAFDSGEEPVQAMICGTLAVMSEGLAVLDAPTEQAENLRKIISIHRTEYPARDLSIVDLMPNGCSKGSALARLAEDRGVDAAEIVAIGDNMNDAEMLAYAGRAIVMENSPAGVAGPGRCQWLECHWQ